jgi:hypothetical protein
MHQVSSMTKAFSTTSANPHYHQSAIAYYLRGLKRLEGEVGVVSLTRWRMNYPRGLLVTNLVSSIDMDVCMLRKQTGALTSSRGPGIELETGLVVLEEKMYREEHMILRHELQMQRHDELELAYIVDGHMMY